MVVAVVVGAEVVEGCVADGGCGGGVPGVGVAEGWDGDVGGLAVVDVGVVVVGVAVVDEVAEGVEVVEGGDEEGVVRGAEAEEDGVGDSVGRGDG